MTDDFLTNHLPKQSTDNEKRNTDENNFFNDESTPDRLQSPHNNNNHKNKGEMSLDHMKSSKKSSYKNPVNIDILRNQKPPTVRRKNRKLTLEQHIENETPSKNYVENEIVIATIPGYAPWPARILSIQSETIMVEFFGTGQMLVAY